MFRNVKIKITLDEVKHIFGEFDKDNKNALNYQEYKECCLSKRAEKGTPLLSPQFNIYKRILENHEKV